MSRQAVVGWAWASLIANIVIILTGGLVRITGSGLGCDTWPKCSDQSLTYHPSMGIHGAIEFGNRTLTFVLVFIAIGTVIAVLRSRHTSRAARRLAVLAALGIPLQAVVGGVSVLTDLNPWVVGLHFILSVAMVIITTILLDLVRQTQPVPLAGHTRLLARIAFVVLLVAVYLGTVVTGSGPYAGDENAHRNGLRPDVMSMVHAGAVVVVVTLALVVLALTWRTEVRRGALLFVLALAAQGAIGWAQYVNDLPRPLLALHLIGSGIVIATATHLLVLTSRSTIRVAVPAHDT